MCDEAEKLRGQVAKLTADAEAAAKKLKEAEDTREMWHKQSNETQKQLDEAHSMVDLFPGAPGRQSDESDSYRRTTYTLSARLAGWMATRTPSSH